MKILAAFAIALATLAAPAAAGQSQQADGDGTLNPEEMTLNYFANNYDFKNGKSTACVYGYAATKSGDHEDAVKIFDKCIAANVDAAMIWMSYMHENGYAVEKNPEMATEWSKRAALRGYKVGEFDYGLSLLTGHGVARDEEAAKLWIGKSAAQGFDAARELIESGYDPDVAIPDADEPRYW